MEWDRANNKFFNRTIERSELPKDELFLPDLIELSYCHLESLNLATWPFINRSLRMLCQEGRRRVCAVTAR
jgi:hypothetical protein